MRDNKRYKEINITADEIFNYKNNKKKYSKRKSENKFVKALYSAFMMLAGAGVIAVSLLTSSVNNVSLFARNASSLTFYVNFDEKDTTIEYDLVDKSNNIYYPDEDFGAEVLDESDKPDYIHFTGLSPDTEYTFTVRDTANDNKTLYSGLYMTGKKDVDVSCETWFESTGLKGYIYDKEISGFYSVIVEDTTGKRIYSKDYNGSTNSESNGQYFEIPAYKLKDSKYNLYIKYKNEKVYQQTLIKTGIPDSYIEVKTEIKDGNLVIDYYYHGYSDLTLEVKDKNNKSIDKRSLYDYNGTIKVSGINDDEYYLQIRDKNGTVYSDKIKSLPEIEIIENRLENGNLYLKYIIRNYTGSHTLSVLNSLGEEEKHFESDKNEIEKEFFGLKDNEYSIVISTSKSNQVSEKVTNKLIPTLDYSYEFKYGVLNLTYYPENLETNDQIKINIIDKDGKAVYSELVDYISNDAYSGKEYVSVGPSQKSLVLKNLFGKTYIFTIEQNGKELFREQLYQNSPELKPTCDYSFVNGHIKAVFEIDKLGLNSLTGILKDSNGKVLGKYDISDEFIVELSNASSNMAYSFSISLSDEVFYETDFISYEDDISVPDIILLKDTFELPTLTSLGKSVTYKLEHNGSVSVEGNILKNNNPNQSFDLILTASSNFVEKEIKVYSYPKVQNKLVSENQVTYTLRNHALESSFEYFLDGESVVPETSELSGQFTVSVSDLNSGSGYKFEIKYNGITLYEDEFKTPEQNDVKVNYFDYELQNGDLSARITIENLEGEYLIIITDENGAIVYSKVQTSPECAIYADGLNENEYYLKVMYSDEEIFSSTLENILNVEVSTQYLFKNGVLNLNYTLSDNNFEYNLYIVDNGGFTVYSIESQTIENSITIELGDEQYTLLVYIKDNRIYKETLIQTYEPSIELTYDFLDGNLEIDYSIEYFKNIYTIRITDAGIDIYTITRTTKSDEISLNSLDEGNYVISFEVDGVVVYTEELEQSFSPSVESFEYEFTDGVLEISYVTKHLSSGHTVIITDSESENVYINTYTDSEVSISLNELDEGDLNLSIVYDGNTIYTCKLAQTYTPTIDSFEYEFKDGVLEISYVTKHLSSGHTVIITDSESENVYVNTYTDSEVSISLNELDEGDLDLSIVYDGNTIYTCKLAQTYTPSIESFEYTFVNGELNITFDVTNNDPGLKVRILDQNDFEWYYSSVVNGANAISLADMTDVVLVNVLFEYEGSVLMIASLVPENPEPEVVLEGTLKYGTLSFEYSITNPPDTYKIYVMNGNTSVAYSSESLTDSEGELTIKELFSSSYTINFISNETIISSFEIEDSSTELEISQEYILVNGNLDLTIYIEELPDDNSLKAYINSATGLTIYSSDVSAEFSIAVSNLEKDKSYILLIKKGSEEIYSTELEYTLDSIELPSVIFLDGSFQLPTQTLYGEDIVYSLTMPDFAEINDNVLSWVNEESKCSFTLNCVSDSLELDIPVYPSLEMKELYIYPKEISYYFINHELLNSFTYYLNDEFTEPYIEQNMGADFVLVDFSDLEPGTEYSLKIMYGEIVVLEDTQSTYAYPQYEFTNVHITHDKISFTFTVGDNPNEFEMWVYGDDVAVSTETSNSNDYVFEELDRNTPYIFYVMCNDDLVGYQTFTTLDYPNLSVEIISEEAYTYSYMMKFTMQNVFDREIEYYINGEQVQVEVEPGTTMDNSTYTIQRQFDNNVNSINVEFKETIVVEGKETVITLYSHQLEIQ